MKTWIVYQLFFFFYLHSPNRSQVNIYYMCTTPTVKCAGTNKYSCNLQIYKLINGKELNIEVLSDTNSFYKEITSTLMFFSSSVLGSAPMLLHQHIILNGVYQTVWIRWHYIQMKSFLVHKQLLFLPTLLLLKTTKSKCVPLYFSFYSLAVIVEHHYINAYNIKYDLQ